MTQGGPVRRAGEGRLTYALIVRDAIGMLRTHFGRVAAAALLLFVGPAVLVGVVGSVTDRVPPGEASPLILVAAAIIAVLLRLVGEVGFAGYLDEAVGRAYFRGQDRATGDVLRSLPWVRLVVADVAVVVGTSLGLALLVVPGVAFYVLFGLVGPVIVQERRAVVDAFRRTFAFSRTAILPIIVLVAVPTALEIAIEEVAHRAIKEQGLVLTVLVEWGLATVLRGAVGLMMVALAVELMARNPEPENR
jgi:hypothetical protein